MTQSEKGERFRALHAGEPFVIPNPWDAGTAKVLSALGFQALATTSSGAAFTAGRADGGLEPDEVFAHVGALAAATDVPVSADLENGFGADPEQAADAIRRAAQAGAVGASIEDWDPGDQVVYCLEHAEARIAAAAEAARALDFPFTLTARAENHIRGNPDLRDTIARLQAYERAGADVLYAPGVREADHIRAVRGEVGRPLNVLATFGMRIADCFEAGAQRVSVGGGLAWISIGAMVSAARELQAGGEVPSPAERIELGEWLG